MSTYVSVDCNSFKNNKNVPDNVKYCINARRNNSGSQEIFSDDDHGDNIPCNSLRASGKNDTFNSSEISMKTPTICLKDNEETPGKAKVPVTPADLLPFIKKTSFLWTSDMETPEKKINDQSNTCDKTFNSTDTISNTPTRPKTPPEQNMEINPKDITSPVLGGKKRSKRKVKRRILNNINFEFDNNNDQQSNTSSDRVPSETTSITSSEVAFDIHKEIIHCPMKKINNLINLDCKENKLLEDAVNTDKNSNSSTQDFFSNASFTCIDHLCSTAIQEEKFQPESKLELLLDNEKQINLENKENSTSKNVSDDVLERVAAIRMNQKPLRRSTEISHTVIPKEVFSKSVMELELADAKFSQEKKTVINKAKPLALMSFSKLSSLDNNFSDESSTMGKNGINFVTDHVPVKAVNNTNINNGNQSKKEQYATSTSSIVKNNKIDMDNIKIKNSNTTVKKESFKKVFSDDKSKGNNDEFLSQKKIETFNEKPQIPHTEHDSFISNNKDHQSNDGFQTAKGKNIPINQDKFLSYIKIYQEIEKEIPDENTFLDLKKKKEQPKKLPTNFEGEASKGDEKTEKLKLSGDLKLNKIPNLKIGAKNIDTVNDGFSTARGGEITISKDKENHYLKIYNELCDDIDLCVVKTSNLVKTNIDPINQRSRNDVSCKTAPTSSTRASSDGFSTARGGEIPISEEKENHYMKIYSELSDDTDFSAIKKSNVMKPVVSHQPVKVSSSMQVEISSLKVSSHGFATARGEEIAISNEKEEQYLKIYNELNDIDEDNLINIKTNKQSNLGLGEKSKDKVVLAFNKKPVAIPNVKGIEIAFTKFSNDGFSTASGIDIPISNDKESYYLKIYNELNDDIPDDFLKNKLHEKPLATSEQTKAEPTVVKKENENFDNVFEELGDLAEFFSPPHYNNTSENINADSNFVVPNSSNILKKVNQSIHDTAVPQMIIKKEVLDNEIVIKSNKTLKTNPFVEGKSVKNVIGLLKRKLDDCEAKRTGRCRSFGGFSTDSDGVTATKLNKSDPHNESSVNQPLQKCLSVSQCFDAHSDSWLSKVEISYLSNNKIISPQVKNPKKANITVASNSISDLSGNYSGFSAQESLDSFRLYSIFKSFLRNKYKKYDKNTVLDLEVGHSIIITNQTSSKRQLSLQYDNDVGMKLSAKKSNYILMETVTEKIKEGKKTETNIAVIEIGKRKHADTDSDTPLTSLKKPRIGSELQGRKLFSDESDNEMELVKSNNSQPLQSIETQELEIESEEKEVDLSEERMSAILQQEKIIRNKKRMKIKPTIGTLLSKRLANSKSRTSWSQLVGSSVPMPLSTEQIKENNCDEKVLEVTAANSTCYTFLSSSVTGKKNVVSLDVGDGAVLIFDKNGRAGVSEFSQAFFAMPGIDPKLLPAGWVENHYKWIVWKLASLDRIRFNYIQLTKNLTPQRVMNELKYRYDREIDKAERPALRRILEKDDVPSRRMVLCISSIKECTVVEETDKEIRTKLGLPRWKVEATDGWYDIPLTVDSAMSNYISTGKIKEGTKIITYGAELMECERGFFPLDKPPSVSLKIHTNSTRRAKWDTKLGYQPISRPLPVKLRDIIAAGGMIGEITAAAARVYPVLYREKTADGKSIYRNARCEDKASTAHEQAMEMKLNAMYAEAQKNFDSKKQSESDEDFEMSQTLISQKFNHYERKQEEFKRKLESQVRQSLPPRRDVTTVMKIRLVDDASTVILSIWGAGDESNCDIKEGDTVSVYNSFTSGHRGGDLHLTASRITHIKTEPLLKLPCPKRVCTLIPAIGVAGFEPKFGEFDTVGVIVSSGSAPYGMKNFEAVNVAYPKSDDTGSSYLSILFWNGISSFGYQGTFTPGSCVACSNLEWRRNLWSIAVAYCSEKSVFTINPRQAHLMKELRNLKSLVQNPASYAESCAEEVATELAKKPQSRLSQGTPASCPNDRSVSFASPIDNCSPGNVTLQKRLEKLSRYGPSPEISPIVLNDTSTRIKKDFTPVTRNKT